MSEEKQLTIYFNNGAQMTLAFPQQIKNSMGALIEIGKRILEADKLVVDAEGRILIIPWSSVKYVDASAVPSAALPMGAIKGARIVSEEKQS